VLFSLKNCKIRQTLGALPPDPLASDGWGIMPSEPHISQSILRIVLSASAHKAQTLSESTKKPYFLVIIAKCTDRKNYAAFRKPQTTEIITIGFNLFRFVPTHFALASPLPLSPPA